MGWLSVLGLSACLTLGLIAGLEIWLRALGAEVSFDDTPARWARVRAELARDDDPRSIAILGASRIQAGLSHDELRAAAGDVAIHNLAWAGRAPYAALADIAERSEFRGLVIVSLLPHWIVPGHGREEQEGLVAYYHERWNWAEAIDAAIADAISACFVLADSHYKLRRIVRHLIAIGRPFNMPDSLITTRDREQRIDFARIGVAYSRDILLRSARRLAARANPPDAAEWLRLVAELQTHIAAIEARGGRVVLVRMPSGGEILKIEEALFPRDRYWDVMAASVSATSVHFEDVPGLLATIPVDGSHIDQRDKAAFARAFAAALQAEGLLSPADGADPEGGFSLSRRP
ncbi:MAG: hypothetical protein HXY25_12865 [Alphaproteobacteria bacterium]|nr:hypothetical protein [Alphaproteobacteria bacterium]